MYRAFIAGGVAACGAVTVTHGFETVKIRYAIDTARLDEEMLMKTICRLQLQGELQSKKDAPRLYRGVLHGVGVIYKNEGFKGLLRGLNCAVRCPPLQLNIACAPSLTDATYVHSTSTKSCSTAAVSASTNPSAPPSHAPSTKTPPTNPSASTSSAAPPPASSAPWPVPPSSS